MAHIRRQYPGKNAQEIYTRVDEMMQGLTAKMGLKYDKDPVKKTGRVSKMGIAGTYVANDGEVLVDLSFPMIIPGSMKKQVQQQIEQKLDGLFT